MKHPYSVTTPSFLVPPFMAGAPPAETAEKIP
jgi:hypothetical protein